MRKSGVKFGLIGTASSLKKGAGRVSRPIGSKPVPHRPPPGATSVFDTNSDDEEGPKGDLDGVAAVNKRLAAISAKQEKQAKKEYEEALDADPSVFDYDRVYDGMKESRESKVAAAVVAHEKEKRQPKYIGNLLKQAKMRAVESDRIFERKLQKEREEQDKLEGEATMKFVTSAYKKKLMEQKKWELQQQLEDEREQRNDVTKTGMSGFYSNLITKNIAMGGDVEKSANSAFTAGSKRHKVTDDYEMRDGNDRSAAARKGHQAGAGRVAADIGGDGSATPEGEGSEEAAAPTARMVDPRAAESKRNDDAVGREEGRDGASGERESEAAGYGQEGRSASAGRRREEHATGGTVKRARLEQVEAGGAGGGAGESKTGSDNGTAGKNTQQQQQHQQEGRNDERTAEEKEAAEELEKARQSAEAKAKKEATVKAARERFLARKKKS